MGIPNALTMGIAHAAVTGSADRFVQADVMLAPGNSGGPLADVEGRVVGINSMVVGGGLALAVPTWPYSVSSAPPPSRPPRVRLAPALLRDGGAALGIVAVEAGGRAERAGLQVGDVLLGARRRPVAFRVPLDIVRGGTAISVPYCRPARNAIALPDARRSQSTRRRAERERLARLLGDRVEIVPRDAADVIVRDTGSARDALATIADGFGAATIVLVDDPHADVAAAALRAGASAVLARQVDLRELLVAMDGVRAGLIVLDSAARDALTPIATPAAATLAEPLTERERQVVGDAASGLSNRRIAERLAISENTIKAHVAAILAKLGATTRTEAVTLGLRLGLVML